MTAKDRRPRGEAEAAGRHIDNAEPTRPEPEQLDFLDLLARLPRQHVPLPLAAGARPAAVPGFTQLMDEVASVDPWWRDGVDRAIQNLAETGRVFDVDDVRAQGVGEPDHHNRWGAAFYAASRLGIIRVVDVAPSARPSRHHGLRRRWTGTPRWVQHGEREAG